MQTELLIRAISLVEGQRDERPGKGWQGPSHQAVAEDGFSQSREFLGHKRVKHKRAYLRSFGELRWSIWEGVIFRCLEGARFGICPVAVITAPLEDHFHADPQRV